MNNVKFDRRKKYYLILDCETATMPYASNFENKTKKDIALAKPLIYDIGWQVIDRQGNVYAKRNYLITEIFSVPEIFNTAYYANKRPLYLEKLANNEIELASWRTATAMLENDLQYVESIGAYNSMFDFKKALPFTELYINMLYSPQFNEWNTLQNKLMDKMATEKPSYKSKKEFDRFNFAFRGNNYPLFDIWGLACEHIINNDEFKTMCCKNNYFTASGKFFSTTAETTYRYYKGNNEFIESHTALDDTEIESEIFTEILRKTKNKFELGITYFPHRILGKVEDFAI